MFCVCSLHLFDWHLLINLHLSNWTCFPCTPSSTWGGCRDKTCFSCVPSRPGAPTEKMKSQVPSVWCKIKGAISPWKAGESQRVCDLLLEAQPARSIKSGYQRTQHCSSRHLSWKACLLDLWWINLSQKAVVADIGYFKGAD